MTNADNHISYIDMMNKLKDTKEHCLKYLTKAGDFVNYNCRLKRSLPSIHIDSVDIELMAFGYPTGEIRTINTDCIVRFDKIKVRLSK
jgi:hypothetical protein